MTRGDAELQSDAQRPRQRHPPSVCLSGQREGGRGEGGGRGRLDKCAQETEKSWSGHHRLEIYDGPSNGGSHLKFMMGLPMAGHNLAQGRPDFFALLRSLPPQCH